MTPRAKARAEDEENALRFVLGDEMGRAFVWRLLERAGVFRTSFAGEAPLAMAFNEGARNAGLQLMGDVAALDARFQVLMAQEAVDRQRRYDVIPAQPEMENDDANATVGE